MMSLPHARSLKKQRKKQNEEQKKQNEWQKKPKENLEEKKDCVNIAEDLLRECSPKPVCNAEKKRIIEMSLVPVIELLI